MEGGLKRAAPTRSARSLRPGAKETAAHPPRPRCFGSARAQAAAGASVSSIKWDEHGAGLFWGSRGRSRHGGDPRPRAQQRSDRDPIVPDSPRYSDRAARTAVAARRAAGHGLAAVVVVGRGERVRAGAALISRCVARARGEARGNHGKRTCNLVWQSFGKGRCGGGTSKVGSRARLGVGSLCGEGAGFASEGTLRQPRVSRERRADRAELTEMQAEIEHIRAQVRILRDKARQRNLEQEEAGSSTR